MIRLHRGEEPAELRTIRETELARVRALRTARPEPLTSKEIGTQYKGVRDALYRTQHGKCCFCEWPEQLAGNPVEHFRPKAEADRRPGSAEREGYWWLAWTWENLLFACETCNGAKFKGVKFPLASGSPVLRPEAMPPGEEQPLFIDPYAEDPGQHIEFARDQTGAWLPRPRRGQHAPRAANTIDLLGLGRRQELLDQRATHVKHWVMPAVERIEEAIGSADAERVRHQWEKAMASLFAPRTAFQALSRDVLAHHFDAKTRGDWGLRFPDGMDLAPPAT